MPTNSPALAMMLDAPTCTVSSLPVVVGATVGAAAGTAVGAAVAGTPGAHAAANEAAPTERINPSACLRPSVVYSGMLHLTPEPAAFDVVAADRPPARCAGRRASPCDQRPG